MRTQVLFVVTIGAALVVPAVAIHIGGFLAYLSCAGAWGVSIVLWRQAVRWGRLDTVQAIRRAIGVPLQPPEAPAPSASAQD